MSDYRVGLVLLFQVRAPTLNLYKLKLRDILKVGGVFYTFPQRPPVYGVDSQSVLHRMSEAVRMDSLPDSYSFRIITIFINIKFNAIRIYSSSKPRIKDFILLIDVTK